MAEAEVIQLQKHLALLREEHVKLQGLYEELNRKYEIVSASSSQAGEGDGFVFRLLSIIAQLYNKSEYSDVDINIDGKQIRAHKFVLRARTEHWGVDLDTVTSIDLPSNTSYEVGAAFMKWLYTDAFESDNNVDFLLSLLKCAGRYKLFPLMMRCEQALTTHVTVKNCIRFYQTANDINAETLKSHCSELISNNWDDFTSEDFASMPAPLLYQMFKSKSNCPLHRAIKAHREDVVFLCIVEFGSQLEKKLNEKDDNGVLPLELALTLKQKSIAQTLVRNKVDLDVVDHKGESLLHKALNNCDTFSASFLIENGINPNHTTYEHKTSALHLISTCSLPDESKATVTENLLRAGAEVNLKDTNGSCPLHIAVRSKSLPVFSTLLEHSGTDLNLLTNSNQSALSIALSESSDDGILDDSCMAAKLIDKGCAVNVKHPDTGETLLHALTKERREAAAIFLAQRKVDLNIANNKGETTLHLAAQLGLLSLVKTLLAEGANPNCQTLYIEPPAGAKTAKRRVRQVAVALPPKQEIGNKLTSREQKRSIPRPVADSLAFPSNDMRIPNSLLLSDAVTEVYNPFTVNDTNNPFTEEDDSTNPFVDELDSDANQYGGESNQDNELLDYGAPYQSAEESALELDEEEDEEEEEDSYGDSYTEGVVASQQTAIHLAIVNQHETVVEAFLQHKDTLLRSHDSLLIIPNFSLKDSLDQTPLAVALWSGLHNVARKLMLGGANVNDVNSEGLTLLHQAILKNDTPSCIFLIDNRADISKRTRKDESALELAISKHLAGAVSSLCSHKAPVTAVTSKGEPLIWHALECDDESICDILVKNKCDLNYWHNGPEKCLQSLLHRAISAAKQKHACYFIANGCDLNSPRKPGLGGEGGPESRDGQSPLHMASATGQEEVVQKLMECGAAINTQDCEGRSALHVSISNKQPTITYLLLSHPELDAMIRDKSGWTPFATAMTYKDNKAAQAILDRAPTAADQFDNRGRNFLHVAIVKSDIESVLFLISVHANVNSRMRDSGQLAPLHLAVKAGSEIIVRNLLLAGANVNDLTLSKQTALHIAALHDHSAIASILIENGVNFSHIDDHRNNALHVAVQNGQLATCRVLITETSIDAEAVNLKGQNPLHILGQYGKENAAAIFDLFIEAMPQYPIDKPDMEGNTLLLLGYMNGNGNLCRAAVRHGCCLGQSNLQSVNIFNAPVATRSLLLKLLDMLSAEPPWSEGDNCLECATKFNLKTRKHHCRHCGRLLCSKCSSRDIPIIKFSLNKPVRVCNVCFDVLTLGTS
ncbi:rabankyrin-5-like [Watersipora subatra]|uniref:rabankyrin-5-like n=1 Tax=Watersipora subatra TaxID=2589382 RepID=UPI00355ADC9B